MCAADHRALLLTLVAFNRKRGGICPACGARQTTPCALLCVYAHGFSLHAGACCEMHDRQRLERLCRYITRPAISNACLRINAKRDRNKRAGIAGGKAPARPVWTCG